tara:strand:- start:75 stop:227 length:153 start_codon:yes stop_codon:yes gene_type:complete
MDQELIDAYIKSLNDKEKKAYQIAKEDLETSFDITKSIGFIKFKESAKKK